MSETVTVPELETPRLRLRAWDETDAEALHAAFGDAETMRFWSFPARRDVAETAALIRDSRSADPGYHAAFAILLRETNEPIGMINYHERRPIHRRLTFGWILIKRWRRQGFMREAVPALLDHCFDRLDTHRVEARIEAENTASAALADWLGFQREGMARDWMWLEGEPRSPLVHALLRPDWIARRDQVSSTSNP
jgi:ribosomal-protein-alanine N-acetyltransferase